MTQPPFHLAFPVTNLEAVREFYVSVLNCSIGRESDRWIDFDFFGHQITAHLDPTMINEVPVNSVDCHSIPARHFGVILDWSEWDGLVDRIRDFNINFYIEPYTRFKNQTGEQRTFFIQDPSRNYLEFKCFKDKKIIFEAPKNA